VRQKKVSSKGQAVLRERAWSMRHAPTESEQALWRCLSGGKLRAAFKRQVPLGGRYIADFVAPSARLVVEVDGPVHARREAADGRRDRLLRRLGYRVLRLPAELVLREPAVAVQRVREALAES
jgi:very-short-patch-repair endonuclease